MKSKILSLFLLSVLFINCTKRNEPNKMDGLYDLYIYDVKKSINTKITNSPLIIEYPLSFSNDGAMIFYKTNDGIQSMNLDGSNNNLLSSANNFSGIKLSPDGKKFVYSDTGVLFLMDIDGRNVRRLTDLPYKLWEPIWSHNGTKIACCSDNGIVVVNLEGNVESITKDKPSTWYDWSFDSKKLSYSKRSDNNFDQIFVYDLDNKIESKITTFSRYSIFSIWRPGFNEILFTSSTADYGSDLIVTNIDGSIQKTILHQASISSPIWSPDGNKIAFIDENSDLALIDYDGKNLKVLNTIPGCCLNPIWSLNGNFILYYRAIFYN